MRGSIDQIEGLLRFETGTLRPRSASTHHISIFMFFGTCVHVSCFLPCLGRTFLFFVLYHARGLSFSLFFLGLIFHSLPCRGSFSFLFLGLNFLSLFLCRARGLSFLFFCHALGLPSRLHTRTQQWALRRSGMRASRTRACK